MRNRRELFGALLTRGAVAFVDYELVATIDGARINAPIVAIMDTPVIDALPATVRALGAFPWLSHVLQLPLLSMDRARPDLRRLLERLTSDDDPRPLGSEAVGRTALIADSSKRHARLDRMTEFFVHRGVPDPTIRSLIEVGEELLMNALYNAPMEAGFFPTPRARTEHVELPAYRACEISYGMEKTTTFVRVRDTFGALKRARLVEVLSRCSRDAVSLDESRGGAGLGLWRIFATASSVSVTVEPGTLTDITVALGSHDSRRMVRPLMIDLCFATEYRMWSQPIPGDERFLIDRSFTMIREGASGTPSFC